ncbi:MAG: hypothetical protein ACOYLO_12780 [Ferruginibacter sp.]
MIQLPLSIKRYLKISLLNLLVVAAIGVILRYKIAFSLPIVDQKHLLHGHSHFAFAGWISQALMSLMLYYLYQQNNSLDFKKYRWAVYGNLVTAYGMLISFAVEGYGTYSILFSTLSICFGYFFAIVFWRDLNRLQLKNPVQLWFKASLLFNALSSIGAFALTIMMGARIIHQNWYLAAEYFYLHFQYNGWFFFSCMGLFSSLLINLVPHKKLYLCFYLFAGAMLPAYFLSALWMQIPIWVYVIVIAAAIAQVIGWIIVIGVLKNHWGTLKTIFTGIGRGLLLLSAIALSIKLLLQLGSTLPAFSTLAFGFRPIVIGYLHLVLLGVISLFILGFVFLTDTLLINRITTIGAFLFTTGIIINEFFLMLQGITAMSYISIPFINLYLLAMACVMLVGIAAILISQYKYFKK